MPIVQGLWQTYAGGAAHLGEAWHGKSLWLSLYTASLATLLSLLSALGLAACFGARVRLLTWLSLPLLAVPHAALAQALAVNLSPSGFWVRLLSPWATGYERPPSNWLWDQHPDGWTLILALAVKELPYFLILIYTYSATLPMAQWRRAGAGLGYSATASWWHLALPAILPRLLLPIFVVLAFSISVVDVAAIAGPSSLKTYAHSLQSAWQNDTPREQVLAGALWLLALTLALLTAAWALVSLGSKSLSWGHRWRRDRPALAIPQVGAALGLALLTLAYVSLALLPLLSIIETFGRTFPALFEGRLGFAGWAQAIKLALPTLPVTLALAGATTTLSLLGALWLLEGESRWGQRRRQGQQQGAFDTFLLIPLLVPQFAFLSGAAFLGLKWGWIPDQGFLVAIWFHGLFVFPYVFLVLAPAFRGIDPALGRAAASLGKSPNTIFWQMKLPILLRPISFAFAWGMAVSLALYLPTFFASVGRFETLLSVGVTQLAGKGESVRAVWGLLLLILPLLFFALAALISTSQARYRRGLRT